MNRAQARTEWLQILGRDPGNISALLDLEAQASAPQKLALQDLRGHLLLLSRKAGDQARVIGELIKDKKDLSRSVSYLEGKLSRLRNEE